MSFIGVHIANTERMCKGRSYEVKAVFRLGIVFWFFIGGLKVKCKTCILFPLHLGTESSITFKNILPIEMSQSLSFSEEGLPRVLGNTLRKLLH